MAKTVTFKGKEIFGKDFTIVDTHTNVKLVSNGMRTILEAIDNYEEKQAKAKKPVTLMDYQDIISDAVIAQTGKLLGLSEEDSKKLENVSYSEVFNFYSKTANDFADMEIPSVDRIKQSLVASNEEVTNTKDPK